MCGLSLLLVLYSSPRGFPLGSPVPPPQKPIFSNAYLTLECADISGHVLVTPWCSMGKQITYLHIFFRINMSLNNLGLNFSSAIGVKVAS